MIGSSAGTVSNVATSSVTKLLLDTAVSEELTVFSVSTSVSAWGGQFAMSPVRFQPLGLI